MISIATLSLTGGLLAASLFFRAPAFDIATYKFTPLAQEISHEQYPAWSHDGKNIAYSAWVHGVAQIFTRTVGASEAAQLTNAPADCIHAFWSADNSTIYYSSADSLAGPSISLKAVGLPPAAGTIFKVIPASPLLDALE